MNFVLDRDDQPVVCGLDACAAKPLKPPDMRYVMAHVDEVRLPRRNLPDVVQRLSKRQVRRMLALAQTVQRQHVDAANPPDRSLWQRMTVADVSKPPGPLL